MYRENRKRWKGKEDRNLVRKTSTVLEKPVVVLEADLLEIFQKKIDGENWSVKEIGLLDSIKRKDTIYGLVVSQIRKSKELFEKEGKTLEVTPKTILELFKKMEKGRKKPPFVEIVKTVTTTPAPTTPTPTAPKKEIVKWKGKGREERPRGPMRYEKEPEGRHDNILWGTPKRYNFGRGHVEAAVPVRSNGEDVWLVSSTPLEDRDLGHPRPFVIPWGKEAEFGNVFRTELPRFSQETTPEGITVIRSEVHFAQEVLQKKGPVAVLFKGDEFCLIHIGEEKLRRTFEQEFNRAQKETMGKNPCIITRLGLIRLPEYRVPDEKVLEILQTAVAAAKAREEKKVTVPKTVTKKDMWQFRS